MIYVLIAVLTGALMIAVGIFLAGVAVGQDRQDRTQSPVGPADALARYQVPPELPRPGQFHVDPWPTTPNVLYSDWQAGNDAREREIRALTRQATEVIPPRWRDG